MSDLERFVELYRSFGIECKLLPNEGGTKIILMEEHGYDDEATKSEKFEGYSSFCSSVEFDQRGTFAKQGFWE